MPEFEKVFISFIRDKTFHGHCHLEFNPPLRGDVMYMFVGRLPDFVACKQNRADKQSDQSIYCSLFTYWKVKTLSLLAATCYLMINFASSLDPDQHNENKVGRGLDPNCFSLCSNI